jgi:hypothetical protein
MDKFNLIKNGKTLGYIKAKNLTVDMMLQFARRGYTIELQSMAG